MAHQQRKGRQKEGEKSKYFEDDNKALPAELASADASNAQPTHGSDISVTIITELRKFRQEVNETLDKLSGQLIGLDQTVRGLGGRVSEAEDRVSTLEDGHNRHTRLVSFLLH